MVGAVWLPGKPRTISSSDRARGDGLDRRLASDGIQRHRIQSNGSCVSSARQPQPHAFHRPRVWWTSRLPPKTTGAPRAVRPRPSAGRSSRLARAGARRQPGPPPGRRLGPSDSPTTGARGSTLGSTSHRPMPLYPSPGRAPRSPPRAAPGSAAAASADVVNADLLRGYPPRPRARRSPWPSQ